MSSEEELEMVNRVIGEALQCPGCSYEYTVQVEDEMYVLFDSGTGIEENVLEGVSRFTAGVV